MPLSAEEAQMVEGEGPWNAFISGLVGAICGGLLGAVSSASVSLGALTIPGWVAGAVSGAFSSAVAAYPSDDFVVKFGN
jgi:outer membrane lipoprotein SlyB